MNTTTITLKDFIVVITATTSDSASLSRAQGRINPPPPTFLCVMRKEEGHGDLSKWAPWWLLSPGTHALWQVDSQGEKWMGGGGDDSLQPYLPGDLSKWPLQWLLSPGASALWQVGSKRGKPSWGRDWVALPCSCVTASTLLAWWVAAATVGD